MKQVPDALNTAAGRQILWRSRGEQTIRLLGNVLGYQGIDPAESKRLIRALDFQPDGPAKDTVLLRHAASYPGKLGSRHILLKGEMFLRLAKSKTVKRDEHAAPLNRYLRQAKNSEYFVKVVDALGLKERHPQLVDMAMTHIGSPLGRRPRCSIRQRRHGGHRGETQKRLPEQLATLTEALANSNKGDAADLLTKILLDPAKPLVVRQTAVRGRRRIARSAG